MPFTFSHPAAVLPLHSRLKKKIPLAALVVGSMVPDISYYLPMPEHFKRNAHTFLGTFTSSLPVAVLLLLLFYWLAQETIFLLPDPHREALQGRLMVPATRLPEALQALCGLLVGAWSHVAWDSFTHGTGLVVKQVAWLQKPIWGHIAFRYQVLQHLSTIFGLCILLYAYNKWMENSGFPLRTWLNASWRSYLWLGIFAACLAEGMIESHALQAIASLTFLRRRHWGFILLTSFVRDFFVAVCVLAISVKALGLRRSPQPQPTTTIP